jgi:hypothetical protein
VLILFQLRKYNELLVLAWRGGACRGGGCGDVLAWMELPPRACQRGEIPTLVGVRRRRDSEVDVGANVGTGPGAPRFASELDVGAGQLGLRRHRQVGLAALTEVVWDPWSGPATPREREDDMRDIE